MMKRLAMAAIVLALAGAVMVRNNLGVLAGNIGITQYPDGTVLVQVPYRRDSPQGMVSVWVAGTEVVHEFPGWPRKYWNDNYYFVSSVQLPERVDVRVAFSGTHDDTAINSVRVSRSVDTGIGPELAGVTRPADSMKMMGDLPDLYGRPGECAPVVAANALIALARAHGADDRMPADSARTVEELKSDMHWTASDGVTPDAFVAGASLWAQKKGLLVHTEKVGSAAGKGTLDALSTAMNAGARGQLRLSLIGAHNKPVGGHLVTVSAVTRMGDDLFVLVNDPRSPGGSDVYQVRDGVVVGYPLWHDGPVRVSWGFTHVWREETH